MDVVQLGLVMMALTICSYNSVLQECLEDQGVIIIFEVISQLSENGGISTTTRDRIKLLCVNIIENSNFTRFTEFTDEQDCIDVVTRALDRIPELNDTNYFQSSESLRDECPELFYRGWLNAGLLGFAAFIMLVLSFTKRRQHFAKHIFYGYPGIIVPVNLLQSTQKYFIHIIIFGAMASDILSDILNPSADFIADVYDNNIWSTTLIFYAQVFIQSLYFAPLLACVNTPIKLVGFLFGLLYSCYFTAIRAMHLQAFQNNCVFFRGDLSHLYPIMESPTYICMLIICVWYAFKTTVASYEMYQWCVNGKLRRKRKRTHQYFVRVKKLLMRSSQDCNSEQKYNKIVSFVQKHAFDSSFNYPLGFSSAVFIALICIFQLTFLLVIISLEGTRYLHDSLRNLEELFEILVSSDLVSSNLDLDFYRYFEDIAVFLEVILPMVPLIAGIFCYVLMFLLVINVQEDINRLYAGDFSTFPKKKPTPTNILASGLRYMGYQVGYFVWTWVIVSLVLYVVALLVFLILLLLQIDFIATLNWALVLIIPTIISSILRYAQIYFAKFAFMQDRGATLSLTNIQVFHWFRFMMIFFNVVVGLTSALLRNIFSLVFGLLLMPRLDRTVMMKGFERFDSGYKTYIGFMYMNLYQNNAVVNVFCLLLCNIVYPKPITIRKSIRNSHEELDKIISQLNAVLKDGSDHEVKSKVSFNRWLLAYTLMKNPQLQELRGHCIAAKKATKVTPADDETETKAHNEEIDTELLWGNSDKESLTDKESVADDKEIVIITTTI